jgi:hypothetical protein
MKSAIQKHPLDPLVLSVGPLRLEGHFKERAHIEAAMDGGKVVFRKGSA